MAFVISAPRQATVPVAGQADEFPVRRVYCIGRNYAAHALEMGHAPDREPPFFFCQPADAVYPVISGMTKEVHHEIELGAAVGRGGRNIVVDAALDHVWGYGVGLDMTRRDLQAELKAQGRSWEVAKAFDHSAPMSPLRPVSEIGHPTSGAIWLDVNGTRRQSGDLSDMIWSVAEAVAELSRYFLLAPGDLLMTGTPSGVGPVKKGDVLTGGVEGVGELSIKVL